MPELDHLDGRKSAEETTFLTADALLDFVTTRWAQRWVTTDIWDEAILDGLQRRPFFILVSVDAPVSIRWKRFASRSGFPSPVTQTPTSKLLFRCELYRQIPPTLEEFVVRNDHHLYNPKDGLAQLIDRAQVRLVNSTSALGQLRDALRELDLTNEARLRPSWDQYFMQLASLAAQRSNCMKRRVGCVLVREKRVISTGYNGTPRNLKNCNEGGCKSVLDCPGHFGD